MNSEKGLWEYLRPKFKPFGHFTRIESGATVVGIPDVDGWLKEGGQVRLELKFTKDAKKGFHLRPEQHRWISDRMKAGDSTIWVVAAYQLSDMEEPDFLFIHGGRTKQLLQSRGVEAWVSMSTHQWFGYPTPHDIETMLRKIGRK